MGENVKECNNFIFIHNFDSGNLGRVEEVSGIRIVPAQDRKTSVIEKPDYEFNIWTRPDCAGTEFENGNRTWFYFGIQCPYMGCLVKLNLVNLNKQGKMYSQGMAPVTRILPGKPQWERIKDKPTFITDDTSCTVSFKYRTPDNVRATTFFAFTYPFSYIELQISLSAIDLEHISRSHVQRAADDIYYHRECVCYSLQHRRVDLLTISSFHGITSQREPFLRNLFPDKADRPFIFEKKKVIFVSARVHPGETPSSFVFNGFLNLLLTRNDPVAAALRQQYVFKLIPFLNPDGVARGHYRTDTRGVNLNRVYLAPSIGYHPSIYAARSLIRFYHFGYEKAEDPQQLEEAAEMAEKYQYYSRSGTSLISEIITKPKSKTTASKSDIHSTRGDLNLSSARTGHDTSLPSTPGRDKVSGSHFHKERFLRSPPKSFEPDSMGKSFVDQVGSLHLTKQNEVRNVTKYFGKYDVIYASTDAPYIDAPGVDIHISNSNEMSLSGPNPLKNLRETLKNSIYLLLTKTPEKIAPSEESLPASEDLQCNIRNQLMELCCMKCQKNLSNLESKLLGLAELIPKMELSDSPDGIKLCAGCQNPIITREPDFSDSIDQHSGVENASLNLEASGDTWKVCSSHKDGGKDGDNVDMETHVKLQKVPQKKKSPRQIIKPSKEPESGLFMYLDLHGHASKKGIFMYGNHFEDAEKNVECMLLPRIMSLNSVHFHFSSCNFTERNMYLKDRRDGMSREGSGRVAVLKATGLIRSYTLECNYNTGRLVNVLPPSVRDMALGSSAQHGPLVPPKYTPHIFEEVGKALGASILDLTEQHPNSRIPASEHRNLASIKDWLRAHSRSPLHQSPMMSRSRQRSAPPVKLGHGIRSAAKTKVSELERKENTYIGHRLENDGPKRISKVCLAQDCSAKNSKRPGINNVKILAIRPRATGDPSPLLKNKLLGSQRNVAVISMKKPSNVIKISNSQVTVGLGVKNKMCNLKRINDELNCGKSFESDQGVSSKMKLIKSTKLASDSMTNSKDESKKKRKRSKDTMIKNPLMKPLRRLKMSQYKLGDVSKDKFRLKKKQTVISSSTVGNADEALGTWESRFVPTGIEMESRSNLGQVRIGSSGNIGRSKRSRLQKLSHNN